MIKIFAMIFIVLVGFFRGFCMDDEEKKQQSPDEKKTGNSSFIDLAKLQDAMNKSIVESQKGFKKISNTQTVRENVALFLQKQ